jgi:hypothetical protein
MYVGELGADKPYQLIGRSDDLLDWEFEKQTFLEPMPEHGVEKIHEPATLLTNIPNRPEDMIMTFNYEPAETLRTKLHLGNPDGAEYPPCGQVLYKKSDPFTPVDFAPEPAGSWGGIISVGDEWVFGDQEGGFLARAKME